MSWPGELGFRRRFRYLAANAHLDLAALRAIAFRFFGESFSARAFPPFSPPSRPNATAAGFFGAVPVLFATIAAAIWFTSLGITRLCLSGQGGATPAKFKLSHYPYSCPEVKSIVQLGQRIGPRFNYQCRIRHGFRQGRFQIPHLGMIKNVHEPFFGKPDSSSSGI